MPKPKPKPNGSIKGLREKAMDGKTREWERPIYTRGTTCMVIPINQCGTKSLACDFSIQQVSIQQGRGFISIVTITINLLLLIIIIEFFCYY